MKLEYAPRTIAQALMAMNFMVAGFVFAADIEISTVPLVTYSATTDVKPNVMLLLDDSGSMAWDYLPDDVKTDNPKLKNNFQYNRLAYNPAVRYLPPAWANAEGVFDSTHFPSQDKSGTTNWGAVSSNPYAGWIEKTNLSGGVKFYETVPKKYCNDKKLSSCNNQSTASSAYPYPAPLLWCKNSSPTNACQGTHNSKDGFIYPHRPSDKPIITIQIGGGKSTTVHGVTFGSTQIMADKVTPQPSVGKLAAEIMNQINECTSTIKGNCGSLGYSASVTNYGSKEAVVQIDVPMGSDTTIVPEVTVSGEKGRMDLFAQGSFPGTLKEFTIVSTNNSYPKAKGRTDCTGATCTYNEEMTNYANWYAYYRTRMQLMKTVVSNVFAKIDGSRFRVGLMSIKADKHDYSNNPMFVGPEEFTGSQRGTWYSRLQGANPDGDTTLRSALSTAGRLFAGKLNDSTYNEVKIKDPLQYSCQKNYAILSTDGYWTPEGRGVKIDGTSFVGDVDGDNNSETLADVAAYYYNNDLRSDKTNNVRSNCARDYADHQHMTTFTLGLGVNGTCGPDHCIPETDPSGCAALPNISRTWLDPDRYGDAKIDDLEHAAINGRGLYFSAMDVSSLQSGLTDTLERISNPDVFGVASAATVINPNFISTDKNYVFSSSYQAGTWSGELVRQQIQDNGTLTDGLGWWSAMEMLDCAMSPPAWVANKSYRKGDIYQRGSNCYAVMKEYTSGATYAGSGVDASPNTRLITSISPNSRRIYFPAFDELTKRTELKDFNYTSLKGAKLNVSFDKANLSDNLSQFSSMVDSKKTLASGENLVKYLAGDRTKEGDYYRARMHVLGDIVGSAASYVQKPSFNYLDHGYGVDPTDPSKKGFSVDKSSRKGMVYVGANDGMLHAFEAETGKEHWAYIPTQVLPNMYKLADKKYTHQFFVDSTPEVGDFCPNTQDASSSSCTPDQWKTALVGGLGRGGKGYYALDVTDPSNPSFMWEFSNVNMGYTYGNPRITKLKDGTWVALLTSGYNNADGKGHLYVVKMSDGSLIRDIATNVGSVTAPIGLARIAAHVLRPDTDNTTVAVYGGDLLGNLWRFDVNGDIGATGYDAQKLVTFLDANSSAQPVTTKPTVSTVKGQTVVYVGTGRYLGVSDLSNTQTQSFYAVKDKGDAVTLGNPRTAGAGFVGQTLTTDTCTATSQFCHATEEVRKMSQNPVNWATQNGWYVDFPGSGERVNTDPSLGLGTLVFTTNLPVPPATDYDPCVPDPKGFIYALDYRTGSSFQGEFGGVSLPQGSLTRPVLVRMPDGSLRSMTRVSSGMPPSSGGLGGSTDVRSPPVAPRQNTLRRLSWRALITQ